MHSIPKCEEAYEEERQTNPIIVRRCNAATAINYFNRGKPKFLEFNLCKNPRVHMGNSLTDAAVFPGFRVFAASRKLETMEELAKEGIETLVLDITSDESIASAKDEIVKRTGGSLDILVNNAYVTS